MGWNCVEPEATSLTTQGFTLQPCRFSCPIAVVALPWNNCANTQRLGEAEKLDSQCEIFCEKNFRGRKLAFRRHMGLKARKKSQTISQIFGPGPLQSLFLKISHQVICECHSKGEVVIPLSVKASWLTCVLSLLPHKVLVMHWSTNQVRLQEGDKQKKIVCVSKRRKKVATTTPAKIMDEVWTMLVPGWGRDSFLVPLSQWHPGKLFLNEAFRDPGNVNFTVLRVPQSSLDRVLKETAVAVSIVLMV